MVSTDLGLVKRSMILVKTMVHSGGQCLVHENSYDICVVNIYALVLDDFNASMDGWPYSHDIPETYPISLSSSIFCRRPRTCNGLRSKTTVTLFLDGFLDFLYNS